MGTCPRSSSQEAKPQILMPCHDLWRECSQKEGSDGKDKGEQKRVDGYRFIRSLSSFWSHGEFWHMRTSQSYPTWVVGPAFWIHSLEAEWAALRKGVGITSQAFLNTISRAQFPARGVAYAHSSWGVGALTSPVGSGWETNNVQNSAQQILAGWMTHN